MGTLPADTHINVRYGGNPDGEPYWLGDTRTPQAVSCTEDTTQGGTGPEAEEPAAHAGEGGAAAAGSSPGVWALRCGLYTQGPARLDATATGYEPIADKALSFERKERCEVRREVRLVPLKPDAGP